MTQSRPLERAIPAQFSYVFAEWGSDCGIVHPIESADAADAHFCFDVAAGLLEEDSFRMRKGKPVDRRLEAQRLSARRLTWRKHDWTSQDWRK